MNVCPDIPILDSPAKCAALWPKYPEKVVGMWATGSPHQNVDILWRLREELLKLGVPVVFFFRESAKPMLHSALHAHAFSIPEDIYQLDDAKFFRLLNFVEVLVTNDYCVGHTHSHHIKAKLVGMPHHANLSNPHFWNFFYDYSVSDKTSLADFDYNLFPDSSKIHRKPNFTQLVAGYPKIDLIFEERQKSATGIASQVLLLYPTYVDLAIDLQHIGPDIYVETWGEVISAFLDWCPDGIAVFRPMGTDRHHPLVERLKARFASDGRFFIDEDDDNKFWLARADYFVTDYSNGLVNFCMIAKKPGIRVNYSWDKTEPIRDKWGWIISRPEQFVPLLEEMDRDKKDWAQVFTEKQERDMPTLGRNFALLAGMIKRILDDNDDPAWLKLDKGHTPCLTEADTLKMISKLLKRCGYSMVHLGYWLNDALQPHDIYPSPKIWLLLLRHALLSTNDLDIGHQAETPEHIAKYLDIYLGNALESLPLRQSVGLMRYHLRKYPHESAVALLLTATSLHVSGPHKKRALFFLLMEWCRYDDEVLAYVNDMAKKMPQHFSRPVLDKLNRLLPWIMKIPLPLRRRAAGVLGLKKTLARKYWQAHRALS